MNERRIADTWERGSPYERYIGCWSRQVAPLFLSWLAVPAGRRWLDVGCGTGALSAAILDHCSPQSVVGVEPAAGFAEAARQNLAGRATIREGNATSIPLDDASVDAIVSGLVLNFVPDQRAALAEMTRVITEGGTIGGYVWDYADKMELIRFFWDAAVELDPGAASLHEGARFPSCHPQALVDLFDSAGLDRVEVEPIDIATTFAHFADYWEPFLGGQGPAPAYVASLDERGRARLRERLEECIPVRRDGSIALTARAWAVRGIATQR